MKKRGILLLSFVLVFVMVLTSLKVEATDEMSMSQDMPLMSVDEQGNVSEVDVEAMEQEIASQPMMISEVPRDVSYGVVNFQTKASGQTTNYTEDGTNKAGYLYGYSAADGAYLGTNGSKVKFKVAGVVGWVNATDVQVVDFANVKSVSHYKASNGRLYHYVTKSINSNQNLSSTLVGFKPSYLSENTTYYSYDGHYFYTSYQTMIDDYKKSVYTNSVNANSPYYNYYQYLPHRSKTTITASQLDANTARYASTGKMANLGNSYISSQNTYGVNALLMYSVSALESGWGKSQIANDKNNLFGHGAVDSNPYYGANGYASPDKSIEYHAKIFVSEGYCDPLDYSGRYFGSHLGDKASGLNVKYASDPYWGEKAASIAWQVAMNYNSNDASAYTIGIKHKNENLNVRKEATTSSASLYMTGTADHYPFLILSVVTGSSVSGNTTWYKVQSDPTLDSTRSKVVQDNGIYNFDTMYGYVSSAYVTKISEGTISAPDSSITYGDVNQDGNITPTDYVLVKNHIMKKSTLSGIGLKAADMNQDGNITPTDYVLIKNKIMGK